MCGWKGWCVKKLDKLRRASASTVIGWATGKFLVGLGIGVLLATYFTGSAWEIHGWWLIVLGIVVSIPACLAVFKK